MRFESEAVLINSMALSIRMHHAYAAPTVNVGVRVIISVRSWELEDQ